ncbi:uncharacterized protein EI90DRAFT_3153579 [Cantharellus anzutake]|uniref:uncharacterized protein n=1 Tax=Cantharellus anzutake TaxID=1750568 RepID=UPI00190644BD|nr:uncharacterized protein EI90DRAFT_3153579 [Cantharellus anzutake]KAF8334268.1 hypothetical protein EI90DRAFT_3153579 [Cantharellus anzutake]
MRPTAVRRAAAAAVKTHHKVLVVGGGEWSGGLSVANQIYNKFKTEGKAFSVGDIAIVDGAEFHHYQPGWTLVGSGLKDKYALRRRLADLVPSHIALRTENVTSFSPEANKVTTESGSEIAYDTLVVAAGLKSNWDGITNLRRALADPQSGVSSIYSFETADKTWSDIDALRTGKTIFTQPAGIIKCAGAPQKIMWMAWDRYRRTGRREKIDLEFVTGAPTMFSVPKYSEALNKLRIERGIDGLFGHNLVSIDPAKRTATFKSEKGNVEKEYTLLHAVPPMGPPDFIKSSSLADSAGWVDVDQATLQHKKYSNVFSLGDSSSLPTSKTAAAITAQAPVLAHNLYTFLESGSTGKASYDGYTSCPLLTGYNGLMLCEFKYGLQPEETFAKALGMDQAVPRRAFYHLKKDFFPWVYFNRMVHGQWFGKNGFRAPKFAPA